MNIYPNNHKKAKQHLLAKDEDWPRRKRAHKLVAEIAEEIFSDAPDPVLIAVGGPGGTGKSVFAQKLARRLGEATVLKLDDYKTSRAERHKANIFGPHPDANRIELITEHLAALKRGVSIDKPIYDRDTGENDRTEILHPARWVIVDGEVATYACFRNLIDFSIFIDSHWRTQLATRLGRDLDNRNYSPDKAIATFLHSNLREFTEHGAASKQWADIHLFCNDDYRLALEAVGRTIYDKHENLFQNEIEPLDAAGLIVPVLTPVNQQRQIDERAFVEHLDWLATAGVRRLLIAGTSGEFFSLLPEERLELAKLALEYFPGLVWLQVGGGPLLEAQQLTEDACALGVDGIVCAAPGFYAEAPAAGLTAYFKAIAELATVPLVLYNYSKHTQNPLTPEILKQVDHFGLKDSDRNFDLKEYTPRYFIGSNSRIVSGMASGAAGFVSAMANVWPELYVELEQTIVDDDWTEAERVQSNIITKIDEIGATEIALLKTSLQARIPAYPVNVRPPLTAVEMNDEQKFKE